MAEDGVLFVRKAITITEIVTILENPSGNTCTIITDPPQKPKAGQVYLFKAEQPIKQGNENNNCHVQQLIDIE